MQTLPAPAGPITSTPYLLILEEKKAFDSKLYLVSPTNTWARFSTSVSGRTSLLHFAELVSINISSILPVGKGCCCIRMRVRLKRVEALFGHLSGRLGANLEWLARTFGVLLLIGYSKGVHAKIKIRHGAVPSAMYGDIGTLLV